MLLTKFLGPHAVFLYINDCFRSFAKVLEIDSGVDSLAFVQFSSPGLEKAQLTLAALFRVPWFPKRKVTTTDCGSSGASY